MTKQTTFDRLMQAMATAGDAQAFITRADLAAFGAALLETLAPAPTMADQEYCTLSYLCRRFQCSRDFMAARVAHPSVRKITHPHSNRVKYHIEDAVAYLSNAHNLSPVINS